MTKKAAKKTTRKAAAKRKTAGNKKAVASDEDLAPPSPHNGVRLRRGPGRPKGSKTRQPLKLKDAFERTLSIAGDYVAKDNPVVKKLGVTGPDAYLLSFALSPISEERRLFMAGVQKLMPAEAQVKHQVALSESLEALLEKSYELDNVRDADVIDVEPRRLEDGDA